MTRAIRITNLLTVLACSALVLSAVGCSDDEPTQTSKAATIVGEKKTVGDGEATAWLKLDDAGNPTSVGLTLTEGALTGLPTATDPPGMYDIMLPAQASATAYNHIGLDWNPAGHPPPGIYDPPHFDMHFYQISMTERNGITLADTVTGFVIPQDGYMAPDYMLGPELVPGMGFHAIDTTSHEFHGSTFDKTLIYGYFKGKMIFTEPMITLAYLQSKPNVTENLKLPTNYPATGLYYATTYSVKYDETTKEYTISLDGLTKR